MTVLRSRDSAARDGVEARTRPGFPALSVAPPAPALLGIGAYVPDTVLDNAGLERLVETSDTWILERTGIRERRISGSGETASMMGAAAGRAALERAGNPAIDAIVVATATPDTLFPTTACLVQRRLDLAGVPAFDIGAACSGFLYALIMADSLVRAGRAAHVLVVASEAMSSLVDYGDRSTCVLFGDGAGAAVVGIGSGGGLRAARWGADGREADLIHYGPNAQSGGEPHIQMMGKGTFRIAVERMAEMAQAVCADAGWSVDDVDHVVPHQANMRIVEAVARRLGVSAQRLVLNGDRLGNTSAASIPLALSEFDAAGRFARGDRMVCIAFGAGTTWAGVALEWAMDPPRAT